MGSQGPGCAPGEGKITCPKGAAQGSFQWGFGSTQIPWESVIWFPLNKHYTHIFSQQVDGVVLKKMNPTNLATSASWIKVFPNCELAEGWHLVSPLVWAPVTYTFQGSGEDERLTGRPMPGRRKRRRNSDDLYHNSSLNLCSVLQFIKFFHIQNLIS